MKVAATLIKLLVVCFVFAAVFGQPLVDIVHRELPPSTPHNLPVAGQVFQVAGQDEGEPTVDIVLRAQKACDKGELVRLDATESTVASLKWQILPKTKDFEVVENGRRAFFSSRVAGEYLIIIAGAKDDVAYLKHHRIRVRGQIEPPGPKTIDIKIREWLDQVPESETRDADIKSVASVFEQTAAKLASGEVDIDNMLEATAIANVGVLGERLEDWKPFLTELGHELQSYIDNDQLETREQFQDVWAKIANSLRQAVE